MTTTLERLVEQARNHKMTPQERFEQRVSIIHGQMNGAWSKERVRAFMVSRDGEPGRLTNGSLS